MREEFSNINLVHKDLKKLDALGITYRSIGINATLNKEGRVVKDLVGKTITPYRDVKLEKYFNEYYNGTMIPLGKRYNLIGVDVDNKEDTLKKYNDILSKNKHNTLTISTCNGGNHYYYKLNKEQIKTLDEHDFKSMNDAIFGLHIDIKYTNQIFIGPSLLNPKNTKVDYLYKIEKNVYPITLPNFIFEELCKNITKPVEVKHINPKVAAPATNNKVDDVYEDCNEDDIKRLTLYLDCLKPERFDGYTSWFKIGSIIYNEKGSLELFHKYSKLSKKYDKIACDKQWNKYKVKSNKNKRISIATLINYAKEDNKNKFRTAVSQDKDNLLFKIFELGHTDKYFANIFYLSNTDNIVYDEKNDQWYILNLFNIWESESSHEISRLLSEQLEKELRDKHIRDVNNKVENIKEHNKNWLRAQKYILDMPGKTRVVKNLIEFYKNKLVWQLFDNVNDNLFAFTNGVYDLENDEFRLPHPCEYITTTCGYDYDEPDKTVTRDIYSIIRKMFRTKDEMRYLLTTISVNLSGCNTLEEFFLWKGIGRNGKGVVGDLTRSTFGNEKYYDQMDIDYLDARVKKNACSADEILWKKKNARIIISTEPSATMPIKTNKLKEWSGRDQIQTRGLHGKSFNYTPKFTLILQSNHDITFGDNGSMALLERLKVIEFPFSFVANPKLSNEKLIDRTIKQKVKNVEYSVAFFHILLDHYRAYIANNSIVDVPPQIKELTELYLLDNDPSVGFFEDIIIKVEDSKVFLGSNELMEAFKKYISNSEYKLNYTELKSSMINKGLKPSILKGRVVYRNVTLNHDKLNKKLEFIEEDD